MIWVQTLPLDVTKCTHHLSHSLVRSKCQNRIQEMTLLCYKNIYIYVGGDHQTRTVILSPTHFSCFWDPVVVTKINANAWLLFAVSAKLNDDNKWDMIDSFLSHMVSRGHIMSHNVSTLKQWQVCHQTDQLSCFFHHCHCGFLLFSVHWYRQTRLNSKMAGVMGVMFLVVVKFLSLSRGGEWCIDSLSDIITYMFKLGMNELYVIMYENVRILKTVQKSQIVIHL